MVIAFYWYNFGEKILKITYWYNRSKISDLGGVVIAFYWYFEAKKSKKSLTGIFSDLGGVVIAFYWYF